MLCLSARRKILQEARKHGINIHDVCVVARHLTVTTKFVEVPEETYHMKVVRVANELVKNFISERSQTVT